LDDHGRAQINPESEIAELPYDKIVNMGISLALEEKKEWYSKYARRNPHNYNLTLTHHTFTGLNQDNIQHTKHSLMKA
jgi:hypothetical protein